MSKSLGNTVAPQTIAEQNGADILRLWVASSDFTEDLRIGREIIKANVDAYRRLRNTIRFMLANLAGFDEQRTHRRTARCRSSNATCSRKLAELDDAGARRLRGFDFNRVFTALFNFCTNDLSAFYFDIRKDALYCDARVEPCAAAPRARSLDELFHRLVTWLAPVLCFTMEEAWRALPGENDSVHLQTFPETPADWNDDALVEKWDRVRDLAPRRHRRARDCARATR